MKFTLQRVRLNSGGYDSSGFYWGIGAPLFWYCSDCGKYDGYFRAANRTAAKAEIRSHHTNARFYR